MPRRCQNNLPWLAIKQTNAKRFLKQAYLMADCRRRYGNFSRSLFKTLMAGGGLKGAQCGKWWQRHVGEPNSSMN